MGSLWLALQGGRLGCQPNVEGATNARGWCPLETSLRIMRRLSNSKEMTGRGGQLRRCLGSGLTCTVVLCICMYTIVIEICPTLPGKEEPKAARGAL